MRRTLLVLSGVSVLALLAAGLTEAALAIGHRGLITDDVTTRESTVRSKPTAIPTANPSVAPSPTPAPVASPVTIPRATTNGFVHLRAGTSTASAIVTDLSAGTVVVLGAYQDTQWQEVTVNSFHGYIYRSYLAY